jgi:hypothetical protein
MLTNFRKRKNEKMGYYSDSFLEDLFCVLQV